MSQHAGETRDFSFPARTVTMTCVGVINNNPIWVDTGSPAHQAIRRLDLSMRAMKGQIMTRAEIAELKAGDDIAP